ncbi:rod shape-determining protein MreC [Candidatus Finniella inopinata]|uniref:Cell shape-determining protein MreC n=1 Tax=Candidatus Finniella inopinata TaxID=1696036 RepID=A0A4Q7DIE2_9PROT|nr:rod shape-determining protein MreC [Candidatus Finniella inopinata]RZI45949.1 rod shape-determining protein MreC [Candidatus Finniella inopinata]
MLLSFLGLKASGLRRSQAFFIFLGKFFRHSFKNLHRFMIGFVLLVVFVVLLFNRQNAYLQNCQRWLSDLTVTSLYYVQAPFTSIKNYWHTHTSLQHQIQTLTLENQQLRMLQHQALSYQRENEALRKLVNALPAYKQEFITTRVLGMPTDAFSTLAIEVDSGSHLVKNQVVIAAEGVVGRLYQIGTTTARVLLITDSRSKIPARIATTGEHVILSGQNNSDLKVLHTAASATPNTQPKVGDLLVTSGFGGVYPPGLPVARISSVSESPVNGESFTARVLADAHNLDYVSVLKAVIPEEGK